MIIPPYPEYSYPPAILPGLAVNLLFSGQRSFRRDAQACIGCLKPSLRVFGEENIPAYGPVLITFNHYYRPGFDAWWLALAIAAVVPAEIHWGTTGELTYPGKWYAFLGRALSRWLLKRLAHVYGFTTMPPMPPRPQDVEARARSVRDYLLYARAHPRSILGLAPEGSDNPPTGALTWPAPGAGRFLLLLANQDFPIVPVGAYEEAGELCLRFGETYTLNLPHGLPADEKDRAAAEIVMRRIAALMPERLRGGF
jgi:hypothetical protein